MDKKYTVTLLLTCAGKGVRAGFEENKLLVKVGNSTCLEQALSSFKNSNLIDELVITASETDVSAVKNIVQDTAKVVLGGSTRTQSVKNALKEVTGDIVLIHDGARPFTCARIINDCIESVKKHGSALTVIPSRDTICSSDGETVSGYLGKGALYAVQTPQAFFTKDIIKAYDLAGDKVFNDDGEVYREYIAPLHIVKGETENVKITYPEDMALLNSTPICRVGAGFDCHKLVENRKLILGGVEIPHDKGLLGHSDADVLTHAIMDALLSSLAMRDIGYWFSDKDPQYKDADSMKLLEKVIKMISDAGYKPHNISATIMAEKPKLLKHIPSITKSLANALGLEESAVGIGATTLEGLGFVGREEGICVSATATVVKM
ncbi:MAG: 2-C-methyl-D-erythritol 2,4-cyclodiphosphate synthase [Clostridiales bacterium]|nr:2-C-methyl-D-erythritol 2,4-cyclodiphosphate synthase [Clostridiales bacterium]